MTQTQVIGTMIVEIVTEMIEMTDIAIGGNFIIFYLNFYSMSFYYRDYDRNDRRGDNNYRSNRNYNYESDDNGSDGGNNYSTEPNNKVIVRGLAQHITEADVS